MKKKTILILCLVVVFVLLVPISAAYKDGGTTTFTSLTYKIICWNAMDDNYENGYKTGIEVHFFPNNFKSLDEYNYQSAN